MQVAEAYRICRTIARKEARNFYYSFVALPLSGETADPVILALGDAQKRFEIPSQLLERLVEGTTMDLRRDETHSKDPRAYDTYETFDDLYRYCYLVASVVGLVCIRIFGYKDAGAEKLAEETGIAFQLTNILRDIREDAERGLTERVRQLLEFESERAQDYYRSGQRLMPMISADSRPALWVLITIYHRLLNRIEGAEYNVFSGRISVPTYEKLAILGWGICRTLGARGSSAA